MAENPNLDNLKPRITVMGVGGAGGNAVNNMIRSNLEGVDFIVCNTDAQSLKESKASRIIQIGNESTQGLGAGSKPEVGRASAEEDLEEIQKSIKGSHMLFVTAGMGGGTGTGAAPVIAKTARDMGILTIGVVTKPFNFEGAQRMKTAERGIEEMQSMVDTLIIIPNQNLFRLANDKTTFADAFNMADNVLYSGVRGVTDLMIMPGLINLDFADVRTVMSEMGKAMMGTGEAEGENRAIEAAEAAISNPLLDDVSMRGAKGVLINITGGLDMTLFEVDEAANRIREEVDDDANIIFGSTFDERLSGRIRVSVVATGMDAKHAYRHLREAGHPKEQLSLIKGQDTNAPGSTPLSRFQRPSAEAPMEAAADDMNIKPKEEMHKAGSFEAHSQQMDSSSNDPLDEHLGALFKEMPQEGDAPSALSARKSSRTAPKTPSFLERLGIKKSRRIRDEMAAASPVAESSSQFSRSTPEASSGVPGSHFMEHEPELFSQSQVHSASKEEDNLDIPAFLRKKKPKNEG